MGQEAKRDAIVAAAQRVFIANGYTDTSVDAIAAEAGVSKQTIYNHFGDKENLFRSVIRAAQQALQVDADERGRAGFGDLETFIGDSDDLERDLREFGRRSVRLVLRDDIAGLRRVVVAESARHPDLMDEWGGARTELTASLVRAFERQVRRGALEIPDAQVAVHQLVSLLLTEALMRSFFGSRKLLDAEVDEIVEYGVGLWLRAYLTRTR